MFIICVILFCSTSFADEIQINYSLTTSAGVSTNFTKDNFTNVYFDPNFQYKIICHGWISHHKWYAYMIKAYMQKENIAVIGVDYYDSLSDYTYVGSINNVPIIGELVGSTITNLNLTKNIPLKNMHLIGHSLGGHIAGVIGEYVRKTTGTRVARITGLDPALLGFYSPFSLYKDHNKLTKDDADFVDVIHATFLSVPIPIGYADFYPNGGWYQISCSNITTEMRILCGHQMPILFFILSISGRQFEGKECTDYETFKNGGCNNGRVAIMGDSISLNTTGTYYLNVDYDIIEDYLAIFKY